MGSAWAASLGAADPSPARRRSAARNASGASGGARQSGHGPSQMRCAQATQTFMAQQTRKLDPTLTSHASRQIGHREPYRGDSGSGDGFASRRARAASCSAAMRARASSASDRGAGPPSRIRSHASRWPRSRQSTVLQD